MFLALTFNGKTGLLERMLNKASQQSEQVHQNFVAYQATSSGTRFSGAYVFVPNPGGAKPISNKAEVRVFRGPLVQEVHQQFSPWVSQVVRLYKGAKYAELQWVVGPIPTENSGGTEVVSHFNTSLKNGNAFFTDSNGREMMRRIRNFRETWDLQIRDEVAGNYYPVTSRMHIVDNVRNVQLTILPDRPQGGGSIKNGTMEIMVHRKLRYDDGLGVGEPLNDEGVDNQGIRFTGKHYLFLDTVEESVKLARVMGMEVHLAPTYLFTAFKDDVPPSALTQHVFLREGLPPSVQVLTLDRISLNETNIYLLRLEHMFEKNDHSILSVPAVVKLETLFQPFDIVSVEETTLGGNFHPDDISRLTWMTDKGLTQRTIGSINYKHHMIPPFDVVLQPMEIRTFRVQVVRDS